MKCGAYQITWYIITFSLPGCILSSPLPPSVLPLCFVYPLNHYLYYYYY